MRLELFVFSLPCVHMFDCVFAAFFLFFMCVCACFHVHECVSVFVGHSRLQARLHLAAIKLHASLTPLHSSTAGSCFKAGLH